MTTVTCPLCSEEFNDSRPPVILKCGDSFCKPCISKIIANSNAGMCPECQKIIDYKSSDDIPTNYLLLKLSRKLNINVDTKDDVATNSTTALMCSLHQCKIDKWCDTCKDCLCASCSSEPDCPHPPSKCSVIDLEPMILIHHSFYIKQKLVQMLQVFQSKIENDKNRFDYSKETMKQKKAGIEYDMKTVDKEKLYLMDAQAELSSLKEKVMEKDFEYTPNGVSHAIVNYLNTKSLESEIQEWTEKKVKDFPVAIKTPLQEQCYITQNSYVVMMKNNKSLYGKISFYGDSLFISHFKEQIPTFNSKIFPLSDMYKNDELDEQLVYLKVNGDSLKYEVTLTIFLFKKNDFASNFFLLCSGIEGPSYEGCAFRGSGNFFYSGYYENNNESAPALMSIKQKTCLSTKYSSGNIFASSEEKKDQSRFEISNRATGINKVFGTVLTSMDHLRSIESETTTIIDCGVALKC